MKAIITAPTIRLKSADVESTMFDQLVANVHDQFDRTGLDARIYREDGRIFVETDDEAMPELVDLMTTMPGIAAVMPCIKTERTLKAIKERIQELLETDEDIETFAIEPKRVGDHDLDSRTIGEEIGAFVEAETGWTVDLEDPDFTIYVEARYDHAYLYTETFDGIGGIPVHPENRVVVPLRDRLDAYGAFLLIKRGCTVTPVARSSEDEGMEEAITSLQQYQPDLKLLTIDGDSWEQILTQAIELIDAKAIGTGTCVDDLPEDEEWTLDVPVLTPVSGFTEEEALDGYASMLHPSF